MSNNKKECVFLWLIENYSYCWQNIGEKLVSPVFTANGLEGTTWNLELYPRGRTDEDRGCITFCLCRNEDGGPDLMNVNFFLRLLADDGTILFHVNFNFNCSKKTRYGRYTLKMDEVLSRRKAAYLPKDILTVRCDLFSGAHSGKIAPIFARTRIGIENIYFLRTMEDFSGLQPHQKKTFQILSRSKKSCVISCDVYFSDCSCSEEKVLVEFIPSDRGQILSKCEVYFLGTSGEKIKCAEADSRLDAIRKDIGKLSLSLTKDDIIKNKTEFLPDDKLYFIFDCTFSTGIEFQNIEGPESEITTTSNKLININPHIRDVYTEKLSECSNIKDDLKNIYNNEFLTDVELKTKTNSFPAHKIVLCARSPVFKVMLNNDMKEKNCGFIQLDDLEDYTLEQLLHFLYTDNIEGMQWENTAKLYYAADKYEIEILKLMCSSFLVENVTTSTAIELLLLADTHSDSVLKKAAEDFILQHDAQIFGSEKWKILMESNPQLAVKTMHLKYLGTGVGN